jgi:hypothetical protein
MTAAQRVHGDAPRHRDSVDRASDRREYYGRSGYAVRWADGCTMVLPAHTTIRLRVPARIYCVVVWAPLPTRSLAKVITIAQIVVPENIGPVVRLRQGWDAVQRAGLRPFLVGVQGFARVRVRALSVV